ncbi:MAG: putative HTH-type transcriptional regulator YdfH [Syntrophorhabdaceae bacterium PtaU1.Bin034]|jgi:DNA-binding GntR family transcriptional regulator|nr:MAG: putative HTH-type transcriptional regulator YdfH [Syntrophorhabdaceae bacterium PtaU1.Bin034]
MGRPKKEAHKLNGLKKIEDFRFLSENAYEILKDAIITLKFAPGEKLNLPDITEELGISTTPVREAMNRLIQEGFVVNVPFKGAFVGDVDQKMVEQLAELRQLLEVAAIKRTAAQFTAGDAKVGEDLLEKLEKSYKKNDVTAYVEYSMQFHHMFVDRCGNELMASVIRGFNDHVKRIAFLALGKQGKISPFIDDYRKILESLKARNPEEAGRHLLDHLSKVEHSFDQKGSDEQ